MTRNRWLAMMSALLMAAAAAFAQYARPTVHLADQIGKPDLETLFPKSFGAWRVQTSGTFVLPSPDVQAQLDAIYNQVVSRTYVRADGAAVMLSVAYGGDQSDGSSAHRPEVCYPAQGFSITHNEKSTTPAAEGKSLAVRKLMARRLGRDEPITYWVVVGDEVATTGIEQKLAQMRYGVRGLIADGMLVRVSSIDADMAQAHALQAAFIADLAAALHARNRDRVFGAPNG